MLTTSKLRSSQLYNVWPLYVIKSAYQLLDTISADLYTNQRVHKNISVNDASYISR